LILILKLIRGGREMTIGKMLDTINSKISGVNTLTYSYTSTVGTFTRRELHKYTLYKTEFPTGETTVLGEFTSEDKDIAEADFFEELFDMIISEKFKLWSNYDLMKEDEEEDEELSDQTMS
jgi:hypothetical protein